MKKLIVFLSSLTLFLLSVIPASATGADSAKTYAIFGTPTIDGSVDSAWAGATNVHVSGLSSLASADCKVMWDDEHLYVLADVSDPTPYAGSNPYADSIELWINWTASSNATYSDDTASNYCIGRNNVIVKGQGDADIEKAVVADDSHYIVEVAIPWPSSVNPAAGNNIGINFSVNDDTDNDGTRNYYITWADNSTTYWSNPAALPLVELAEPSPSTTTSTSTSSSVPTSVSSSTSTQSITPSKTSPSNSSPMVAPQTGDGSMPYFLMTLAFSSFAFCLFVFLKNVKLKKKI